MNISTTIVDDSEWEALTDNNWKVTSELNEDDIIKENFEKFEQDLLKFQNILKKIKDEKDQSSLILNFYNNIENGIWNKIFKKFFITDSAKNLVNHFGRKEELIDYKIVQDLNCSLYEEKYKTGTSERYLSWMIAEEGNFSNNKTEVASLFNSNFYQIRGNISREIVKIPYMEIFNKLKTMDTIYPGFLFFIFNSVIFQKTNEFISTKDIKLNNVKYLQEYSEILLLILRYREDSIFNNSLIWNCNISKKIEQKDIGYFSLDSITKIIGNIWISERYRQKGLAKEIFNFIKDKILKTENYFFIQTKNKAIENLLGKLNSDTFEVIEIGRSLPFLPEGFRKERSNLYLNEKTYVITLKDNIEYIERLKYQATFDGLVYTKDIYKNLNKIDPSLEYSSDVLYDTLYNDKETKILILNKTNDKNILPTKFDTYTFENIPISGKILKIENDYYLLPLYENEVYLPYTSDVREYCILLEKPITEIFENEEYWFVHLKFKDGNKKYYKYDKNQTFTKDQLERLFELSILGVENIFKKMDFKPIEINYETLQIKLEVEEAILVYKSFEEIINFLN